MDEIVTCPRCHIPVRPTDYFCYNCGASLHAKPPSITPYDQALLYLGSIFLPPLGIFWGMRYLRQSDQKSKIVGTIAIVLTIVVVLWAIGYTINLFHTINSQVSGQLQGIEGF